MQPIAEAGSNAGEIVSSLGASRRSRAADKLRRFTRTPDAMQAMYRPDAGVPVSKFRPPVYVTLWS